METLDRLLAPRREAILGAFRIMAGLLILQYGTVKHLGFPEHEMNAVPTFSLGGAAGLIELVAGALVAVGLFTRPAAFVLSGLMAAAYFVAHAPQSFYPIVNGGVLSALFCFAFLYIAAAGPGRWSVDGARAG